MNRPLILRGCTPEPLGNYLKALGVFRLVAEQADPNARAWWDNGVFALGGTRFVSTDKLIEWLHSECAYTAFLAPWSTNTGWGQGGKRDAGGVALKKLLSDGLPRTERFRSAANGLVRTVSPGLSRKADQLPVEMQAVTEWVDHRSEAEIIAALRNNVCEPWLISWLDSVAGVQTRRQDWTLFRRWFPLFAKGGAEGSGNYIVRQQEYLADSFCENPTNGVARLRASLTGSAVSNMLENNKLAGLFFPGFRGDPNIGQSFTGETRVNPWDFILLLEGFLLFSSAATRRLGATRGDASFPFYCEASLGGTHSIGLREIPEADKSISSGEIWCPIWKRPIQYETLQSLFSEGRFQAGDRTAYKAAQFALAVTRFGCDRGINAFARYGLIRRSGSYGRQDRTVPLGVSLGIYPVVPSNELSLLQPLIDFDVQLSGGNIALGAGNNHPARLLTARVEYEELLFTAIARSGGTTRDLSPIHDALLASALALSRLVREFAITKGKIRSGKGREARVPDRPNAPLPHLLPEKWLKLEPSAHVREYRLARAIASIASWGERKREGQSVSAVEALRANLLPVTRQGHSWRWDQTSRSAVWVRGATLFDNLAAVLRRRLIDASKGKGEGLPLWSAYGAGFGDLLALWNGEVNEERLGDLIHALALIDTGTWSPERITRSQKNFDPTLELHSSADWFGSDDEAPVDIKPATWRDHQLLTDEEMNSTFALPRVYALLKLCFIGGRLPAPPVEGRAIGRSGEEPYPPVASEILNLLSAGQLSDAVEIAARKLRAKGYPPIFDPCHADAAEFEMSLEDCRRLAGMLLIPVRRASILTALVIKPRTSNL